MRRNYSQWLGFLVFVAFVLVFNHRVSAQEEWINYTNASLVYALAFDGDYVWEGTCGGVIKRSLTDPEGDVTYYTRADGLAGNRVYAVAVDPRGVIWFGTNNGVSKFDGVSWVNYNTGNSGLIDNRVRAIAIDSLGGVWFGTEYGLSYFFKDDWESLSCLEGVGISVITVSPQGDVWVGTRNYREGQPVPGIYVFSPPVAAWYEGINYTVENSGLVSNNIGSIVFDTQGNVWIANDWEGVWGQPHESGICKFDGENWETFTYENSGLSSRYVSSLAIDADNNIWVTTQYEGIFKYDGTTWVNFDTTNSDILSNETNNIYVDKENRVWFTYYSWSPVILSIGCYDGSNWYYYESSNSGLPSNFIKALTFDPTTGDAWLAVDDPNSGLSDVVMRYDGVNWLAYDQSNTGIRFGLINDMTFDKEGNLWIGGRAVYKFDGSRWAVYDTSNSPIPIYGVEAIAVDPEGAKWFLIRYIGGSVALIKFDDSTWTIYDSGGYYYVTTLAIDEEGNKWIGTLRRGVIRFDGTSWIEYNTANSGLIGNEVRSIQFDSQGNVWFGTNKGLSKFDGIRWTNYDAWNSGLPFNSVTALYIDSEDNIWVATRARDPYKWRGFGGVSVFNGTNWRTYDIWNSGVASNWVRKIAEDLQGNMWFIHWFRGISVLKKSTSEAKQKPQVADVPKGFQLLQNYPNPFNSSTTIPYQIPSRVSDSPIKLRIFNTRGQLVKTLVEGVREAGSHSVVWDGRDERGRVVSSGVYFYRLRAGELVRTRKMLLIR